MTSSDRIAQIIAGLVVLFSLASCGSDANEEQAEPQSTTVAEVPAAAEPEPVEASESPDLAPEEPRFELQGDLGVSTEELNELIAFVEKTAGRDFLRPPRLVAQSEADYEAGLLPTAEELADFHDTIDADIRVMQAMGVTDIGVATGRDAWLALMTSSDGVLAYYDTETDTVFLPMADEVDDVFRSTIVHELVHALDGQHVDLISVEERLEAASQAKDFDVVFSLASVVEGRATAVQYRWDTAHDVVQDTELPEAMEQIPPAAVLASALPYSLGLQYIEVNGGASQTWDLYDDGPMTSEAILTGSLDEPVVDVAAPVADGPVLTDAPFGAIDIMLMLIGDSLEPSPPAAQSAAIAADGWAGGHSIAWGDDAESCVRIALQADTADDLGEIETVYTFWVEEAPEDRTIEVTADQVVVTGCAPYLP